MRRFYLFAGIIIILFSIPAAAVELEVEPNYKVIYENHGNVSHKICAYIMPDASYRYSHINDFLVRGFLSKRDILETQVYFKTRFKDGVYGKDRRESQWLSLREQARYHDFEWVYRNYAGMNVFVPKLCKNCDGYVLSNFTEDIFHFFKTAKLYPRHVGYDDTRASFTIEVPIEKLVSVLWQDYLQPPYRDICGVCVVVTIDKSERPDFFVAYTAKQDARPGETRRYIGAEIIDAGSQLLPLGNKIVEFSEKVFGDSVSVSWPRVDDAKYYKAEIYIGEECGRPVSVKNLEDPDNVTYWTRLRIDTVYSWRMKSSVDYANWSNWSVCRPINMFAANRPVTAAISWKEHNDRGIKHFNDGDVVKALTEFLAAQRMKPHNSMILNNLGLAYEIMDDFEKAAVYYTEALAANPGNAEAHNNLGFIHYKNNYLPGAIAEWEIVLELAPGSEETQNNLAYVTSKAYLRRFLPGIKRSYAIPVQ